MHPHSHGPNANTSIHVVVVLGKMVPKLEDHVWSNQANEEGTPGLVVDKVTGLPGARPR
jgi:hypothetical protein